MIPGLKIDSKTEQLILEAGKKIDKTLYQDLQKKGLESLTSRYEELIRSLETQSCLHGPNDSKFIGTEYEICCGNESSYLKDLDCRTTIQKIIDLLPLGEARRVSSLLEGLDTRFKSKLVKHDFLLEKKFMGQYPEERYWWLYRWPLTILEEGGDEK